MRCKEQGTPLMTSQSRSRGDHGRRPLSLLLRCNRAALSLYDDLGKLKGIVGVLKLWKRFRMWRNIVWAWDKFVALLFAFADTGIYPHAASQYHAWPSAARGIAMLRVDTFLIRGSKQGITNNHRTIIFIWSHWCYINDHVTNWAYCGASFYSSST